MRVDARSLKGGCACGQPLFGRGGLLAFDLARAPAAPASAQVDTGTILRHGERRVGRRAARRHGHDHPRRSGVHAVHRDARRTAPTSSRPSARAPTRSKSNSRASGKACGAASRSASRNRCASTSRSQTGAVAEEVTVTAESPLLQTSSGTVGETLKSEHDRKPADQRPRLHHPRAAGRRRGAAAARRARAADVFRQRREAGAEQLPAGRHRQQHEQRRLPERRRLHRQAAGRRRGRDQDPDELVQRRVRPRRRRGAQHDAQVGHQQAARHRVGVQPQRRAERQRLLRQPRRHQERRVPVEPVRVHRRRTGDPVEDVLVRGLRRQPDQAGAHVGEDGSDGSSSAQAGSRTSPI